MRRPEKILYLSYFFIYFFIAKSLIILFLRIMKGTLAEWSKASDLSPDSARSVGSNPTGTNRFFVFVYLNEKHTRKKPKKK